MAPTAATNMRQSLRFAVFQRDGFRCRYCGRSPEKDGVRLNADHFHPKSRGGPATLDNLVTACWDCNIGKSAKVLRPAPERPKPKRLYRSRPRYAAAEPAEWAVGSHCSTPLKVAVLSVQFGMAGYRDAWQYLTALPVSPLMHEMPPCRKSDATWLRIVQRTGLGQEQLRESMNGVLPSRAA